jgi:hypothetical protein
MSASPDLAEGLYEIQAPDSASAVYVYYLLKRDQNIPRPSLDELFNQVNLLGWYVFTKHKITDDEAFKSQARLSFPDLSTWKENLLPRGFVWLPDPEHPTDFTDSLVCRQNSPGPNKLRPIAVAHTFEWSAFGLQMLTQLNVAFDSARSQIIFSSTDSAQVEILYNQVNQKCAYYDPDNLPWNILLPLTGAGAGMMSFQVGLDLGTLQSNFRCTQTYFCPGPAGYSILTYPLFTPVAPSGQYETYPGFDFRLDPLNHLDSSRSRLALDLSGKTQPSKNSLKLNSTYFRAINGAAMTMVPQTDAGFAFCMGSAPGTTVSSPPATAYYLAPVGEFILKTVAGNLGGSRRNLSPGKQVRWMCGLFGQEFVQMSTGDVIEFVSGQAAFSPAFSGLPAHDADAGNTLVDTFTTSWVKYPVLAASQPGYFAQPSASVFYAATPQENFPMAVDALLSGLDRPVIFPAVPYAGIFAPNQQGTPAASEVYAAFEAAVLSSVRHAQLAIPGRGPIFRSSPPQALAGVKMPANKKRRLGKSLVASSPSATALTPQGLVTNLNTEGEWESIVLATSPDTPPSSPELLQFRGLGGSPSLVSTELSSTLMQNQLFMVAATPEPLGQFDSALSLDGFHFNLAVGPGNTVLVFKYNTSLSLAALVASPSLWANPATFVGDAEAISVAQQVVLDAISVAESEAGAPGGPFNYFNKIAQDPAWTGILAFQSPIDGNGMPPDLQMLLGGIDGQLRAHHLGIETNHVDRDPKTGELIVGKSSLFGVIHYQGGAAPSSGAQFDYNVESLTAVFSNSKIEQLAASVGLTMNSLLERKVELTSGAIESPEIPNTMVIRGQYQSQGSVGSLLFSSGSAFVYKFPVPDGSTRVIDRVEITHASLSPIKTEALGSPSQGTHMLASFSMSGELFFASNPFPNSEGLDLFSYGNDSGGLAFSSLTVFIDFTLDAQGKLAPGSRSITLQPQLLAFAPAFSSIRSGSLLNSLPLQFSKFWYAPGGLTPGKLGAVPVQCLQLEGRGSVSSPDQRGPFPAVATSPHYALEYDLPLGSLGSLSEVTVGITAKLLLAWGPSSVIPDNDAAALLVQLPEVFAGAGGFSLEGLLRTTFGDANLLMVDNDGPVYAILFSNIKFSVLGYSFPPGLLIDFVIFAGKPGKGQVAAGSNIAWFLAAQPVPASSQNEVFE